MTLTPHEARHLLIHLTGAEGRIRPGGFTALEKLDLIEKLREIAEKDGGE